MNTSPSALIHGKHVPQHLIRPARTLLLLRSFIPGAPTRYFCFIAGITLVSSILNLALAGKWWRLRNRSNLSNQSFTSAGEVVFNRRVWMPLVVRVRRYFLCCCLNSEIQVAETLTLKTC